VLAATPLEDQTTAEHCEKRTWGPCHHSMAHAQVVDRGDGQQGMIFQLGGWVKG